MLKRIVFFMVIILSSCIKESNIYIRTDSISSISNVDSTIQFFKEFGAGSGFEYMTVFDLDSSKNLNLAKCQK